jgi:hypothetical protein
MGGFRPTLRYEQFKALEEKVKRLEARIRRLEEGPKPDQNPFGQDGFDSREFSGFPWY